MRRRREKFEIILTSRFRIIPERVSFERESSNSNFKPVEFSEMIDCQSKTEHNCHDPEKVEDIMSVWSPYDGT